MSDRTDDLRQLLDGWLTARTGQGLGDGAASWLERARGELREGADGARLAQLLSMASRHVHASQPLAPDGAERAAAAELVPGWDPECWTLQETLRVALLLGHPDPAGEAFGTAWEECFRFADEGEQRALYRALALLPAGERFAWRAGEGCRTNIVPVFEAVACDSPYPARHLDDVAWKQLCIKAIFIGAPLWRVRGLDERLDDDLARMALDLVEERRSAGRAIQPDLWLCLRGTQDPRAVPALEQELELGDATGRSAAVLALARAGADGRLAELATSGDEVVSAAARRAQDGPVPPSAWRTLPGREEA